MIPHLLKSLSGVLESAVLSFPIDRYQPFFVCDAPLDLFQQMGVKALAYSKVVQVSKCRFCVHKHLPLLLFWSLILSSLTTS